MCIRDRFHRTVSRYSCCCCCCFSLQTSCFTLGPLTLRPNTISPFSFFHALHASAQPHSVSTPYFRLHYDVIVTAPHRDTRSCATAQLTTGPWLVYLRNMWQIDNVYFVEYRCGIIPFWLMLYTRLARRTRGGEGTPLPQANPNPTKLTLAVCIDTLFHFTR